MAGRVLIVEDELDTAAMFRDALVTRGYKCEIATSGEDCLARLPSLGVDVVVTDIGMPGMNGIELCQAIAERFPELLTIVVTGLAGLDHAIAAIRAGAYDYLVKPVRIEPLVVAVARALETLALRREIKRLRETATEALVGAEGIAGSSSAIRDTLALVRRVADSDATVLVTGETGTGKELVARAVHDLSPRRHQPFVAINCGAMPAPLLESELFGHVRGAFTDAKQSRAGLFAQAGRGTIFLDEIGEMPLEMQAKLLRALQERCVRPVGGTTEVPFDARILTATNRDLESEVDAKHFREDLFYRINVVSIDLPPLRERGSDVLILAQSFLDRISRKQKRSPLRISPAVADKLLSYHWPGNVRELENCVERIASLARFEEVAIEDLPEKIRAYRSDRFMLAADHTEEVLTIEEVERRYIQRVLKLVEGNKSRAATLLGLDRRTLYRKLERWESAETGAA